MSDTQLPISTPLLLVIALGASVYSLYRIAEKKAVSVHINSTGFGPYALESDPVILWAVIAFHVVIMSVIILYLWMGWEPPDSDPN